MTQAVHPQQAAVVQRQLDACNARDLSAFVAVWLFNAD